MNNPRVTLETFQTKLLTKEILEEGFHKVISLLENLEEKRIRGLICANPVVLFNFISYIENLDKQFNLGNEWFLTTAGGWKPLSAHEKVSNEDLYKRIERALGIPKENCRDMYAMCECRVIFPSCGGNYKHVPNSILHPLVLDDNLEPIGFGEYGRFAFLDTIAHSYPGFIITGDRVKLYEHCPSCDRPGPVIDPEVSRMPGVEDKGCANVVRKIMVEETH